VNDAMSVDDRSVETTTVSTSVKSMSCSVRTDTEENFNRDNSIDSWRRGKATEDHLKTSFSKQISQLEKEFLVRNQTISQSDPLYDKLKAYHDDLLQSVSNTTTEKLTSEVLDVILNPAKVDDSDRRFV